ncbi:hypothetical protein ERUR111494_04510 [Erysipelothrix urinaevulpis]|uniref:hypothetical protein n=1 Tax=Erysipelothrix urinaevulpis TaxID=2683717 RepID=UPI0013595DA2|nr:hypothetical protein [Erysipelothrix urinaevulpis]
MDKFKEDFERYYHSIQYYFEQDFNDVKEFVESIINHEVTWLDLIKLNNVHLKFEHNQSLNHLHGMTKNCDSVSCIWINPAWVYHYAQKLGVSMAFKIHLIHELYHVYEYYKKPFYMAYAQERKIACSEMAANMYVIYILRCGIHPIKIEENIKLNEKNNYKLRVAGLDAYVTSSKYEC